MAEFVICGVPLNVSFVKIDHEGYIDDWNVEIGGVSITNTASVHDFFSTYVAAELEKQLLSHLKSNDWEL